MNIAWRSIWATTRRERSRKWRDTFRNPIRVMILRRRVERLLRLHHRRRRRLLARPRLIRVSRRLSDLRRARSKNGGFLFSNLTAVPNIKTQRDLLPGIEAGQVWMLEVLVLHENLEC